jgi:hypothetical protein
MMIDGESEMEWINLGLLLCMQIHVISFAGFTLFTEQWIDQRILAAPSLRYQTVEQSLPKPQVTHRTEHLTLA